MAESYQFLSFPLPEQILSIIYNSCCQSAIIKKKIEFAHDARILEKLQYYFLLHFRFKTRRLGCDRREVAQFRLYHNEKIWLEKLRARRKLTRHVMKLYQKFPNIDEEALQAEFPEVNLEKVKRFKGAQGHYLFKSG